MLGRPCLPAWEAPAHWQRGTDPVYPHPNTHMAFDSQRAWLASVLACTAAAQTCAGVNPARVVLAEWTFAKVGTPAGLNINPTVDSEAWDVYGAADKGVRTSGSSISGRLAGTSNPPLWVINPASSMLTVDASWDGKPLDQNYLQWQASTVGYRSVQASWAWYCSIVPVGGVPFVLRASPDASFSSAATIWGPMVPNNTESVQVGCGRGSARRSKCTRPLLGSLWRQRRLPSVPTHLQPKRNLEYFGRGFIACALNHCIAGDGQHNGHVAVQQPHHGDVQAAAEQPQATGHPVFLHENEGHGRPGAKRAAAT